MPFAPQPGDHQAVTPAACHAPKLRLLAAITLALASTLAARPAAAIVFQDSTAQSAGLGAGLSYLNAEAALTITLSNSTQVGCSASLLSGGLYLLTAAHCVTGDTNTLTATSISINFANTGYTTSTTSYVVDPTWTGVLTTGGDLAVLKLATAITSITGYTLNTAASAIGDTVILTGYGLTGYGATGYVGGTFGTLRYGANVYDAVYSNVPSVYAFDFDKVGTNASNVIGAGALGSTEAMIAPGDSGGASLVNIGGTWEIVGVHDFLDCLTNGCTPNSTFGQLGGDTSVYANAAWIDAAIGIPEPATALVLGPVLFGLALRRRASKAKR